MLVLELALVVVVVAAVAVVVVVVLVVVVLCKFCRRHSCPFSASIYWETYCGSLVPVVVNEWHHAGGQTAVLLIMTCVLSARDCTYARERERVREVE